jgi:hypothetical protein
MKFVGADLLLTHDMAFRYVKDITVVDDIK